MTHICVSKIIIIGSDNGLSPDRRQAIIWTNDGMLLIGPWGTNFNEISIGIQTFSFKKMHVKMSSAKWRPFCLGLNVLKSNHVRTRRSENDNTPQPLDQWTNSSFIGQQVGNCKSFTLTHYFADLSAMHRGRRSIPLCIQHHIQLTSLSFQVSQTSHCWVTAISIFYLENPRSRSWVRSKFDVTMWV